MNDLVGRLRYAESNLSLPIGEAWRLLDEAASAIERLAQERDYWKEKTETGRVVLLQQALCRCEAERDTAVRERDTLVMAVVKKCPGETRFQTALRYITEAEAPRGEQGMAKVALGAASGGQP